MSVSLFGNISMEEFLDSPHSGLSLEEADAQLSDSLIELERLNFALPRLEYLQAGVESTTEEISAQTISVIDFALEALVGPEQYAEISNEALGSIAGEIRRQAGAAIGERKTLTGKIGAGVLIVLGGILTALLLAIVALIGLVVGILKLIYKVIKFPLVWVYHKAGGGKASEPKDDEPKASGPKPLTMPQSLANKLRYNNEYLKTVSGVTQGLQFFSEKVAEPRVISDYYGEIMGIPISRDAQDLGDNPFAKVELSEQDIESLDKVLKDSVLVNLDKAVKIQKEMQTELKALKAKKDLNAWEQKRIRGYKENLPKKIKANRALALFARQLAEFLHPAPKGK